MDEFNKKDILDNRVEQLEQMLRLYMHEVSQVTCAINSIMKHIVRGLDKHGASVIDTVDSNPDTLLRTRIENASNDISDMLNMMELLQYNIRIGMNLSQAYDEQSDVHIYRDIIFKLKNIYQFELNSKNLSFITPPVTFTADAKLSYKTSKVLLELALYNIISNAVKFSHKGTNIYVECKQTSLVPEKRIITVDDYGVRIEESEKPYELFYRGTESAFSDNGIGLGLFVAKKSIEKLGGQIRHKCKLVSKFYVPYIIEYINRISDSADGVLLHTLHIELANLKGNGLFERIISQQNSMDVTDEELRSNIYIPTYETTFEVII